MARVTGSSRNLTARHVTAVRDLREGPVGRQIFLPGGVIVRRGYRDLIFGTLDAENKKTEGSSAPPQAEFVTFPRTDGEKIPEKRYTKWFDCDKISGDVFFRHRRPGDVIELKGVGKKTVKSYMIDAKIPAERRDSLWLLADGEQILWIVGYRMSAACQVTPETRTILQISVPEGT
ncbi:MAG: tRNA lysidine(34) synthetase TilS [Lachnospiraceae bacterium]|nr:tRNA lysidine(34) synthetase TilS [Lachnospiraceae bacterium]